MILLSPSEESVAEREEQLVRSAVERTRSELLSRQPATPPETAAWLNRMVQEIWSPYVEPLLLKENLPAWQEKLAAAAPAGWRIELTDFSMGAEAPVMSNFQAFQDPRAAGPRLAALDCDMDLTSSSMAIVMRGSGPLVGEFTATVRILQVRAACRGSGRELEIPRPFPLLPMPWRDSCVSPSASSPLSPSLFKPPFLLFSSPPQP